jgi:uncharacterized protein
MRARAWGPLCATLLLLAAGPARAYDVPKQTDYVTDTAGVLSASELADLNNQLGDYERQSGNQIFVLVTASLQGEPIEDVGYQLIQTWRPGQKGKDNGVILIIATGERRIRIETGKGVGGELTDLQSNDIIRQRIAPRMREGRVHDAILAGVQGIEEALSGPGTSSTGSGPPPADRRTPAPVVLPHWFDLCFWGFIVFLVLVLLLRASRHPRRRTYWGGPPFIGGGGWGDGGGWGGGGGDGGGGSGFSGGGGGEGGGGGSSDSY